MRESEVKSHFEAIAEKYDFYKNKSCFYYRSIKNYLKEVIPPDKRILDFGCGTGEILAHLNPQKGVGYDISSKMLKIAKEKFANNKNLRFATSLNQISDIFDYILMIDVVEHLARPLEAFESLKKFCGKKTLLIVSFVDSSWEPLLWILEKARLKMPEGPHRRLKTAKVIDIAKKSGFGVREVGKIPIFIWLPFSPLTFLILVRKKSKEDSS